MRKFSIKTCVVLTLSFAGCAGDPPTAVDASSSIDAVDVLQDPDRPAAEAAVPDVPSATLDTPTSPVDVLLACDPPRVRCDTDCVDPSNDLAHCGTCSTDCRALPGVRSDAVRCVAGACFLMGNCLSGRDNCDNNTANGCEADLTAPATCGACGTTCSGTTTVCAMVSADGGASRTCTNGCTPLTPTRCGDTCADTTSDANHCGTCDTRCTFANASATCVAGTCALGSCTTGFANCDANPANGCETNTRTSITSCGSCGTVCPSGPNAQTLCGAGLCSTGCLTGYHRCEGLCVSLTDLATCGESCTPCPTTANGRATCDGRTCGIACDAGFHLCGGRCVRSDDPNTCGSRCDPCPAGPVGSTPSCTSGTCDFVCNAGFHRCGSLCRADTSIQGCGSSCTACPVATNADATCTGLPLVCGTTCRALWGDCDGDATNGCETATVSRVNCGACGTVCSAGGPHTVGVCNVSGTTASCGFACESGYTDCDGNVANGCEALGACFVDRTLFTDEMEIAPFHWNGTSNFGRSTSTACRNIRNCFGCDHCLLTGALTGSCNNEGTATLTDEFNFSRVVSGTFTFYSMGAAGASDTTTLQVSTNGGASWTSLPTATPCACLANSAPAVNVDLSSVAGQSRVTFRFLWVDRCDDRNAWRWTVDDVTIRVRERTY